MKDANHLSVKVTEYEGQKGETQFSGSSSAEEMDQPILGLQRSGREKRFRVGDLAE